jgi:hypothetical protein
MMRLLLILSCRHADATVEVYRKSWLLNEIVPGFDAEALRVSPSISKAATAVVPLHLRIALLAGLAIAARDVVGTLRHLRPACRPFYLRRFDELASAARGWPDDFSKMSNDEKVAPKFSIQMSRRCANRVFLIFRGSSSISVQL